jgi:hypothetical protein
MVAKKTSMGRKISRKSRPKTGGQRMLSRDGWKLLLDENGVLQIRSPSGSEFIPHSGGRS